MFCWRGFFLFSRVNGNVSKRGFDKKELEKKIGGEGGVQPSKKRCKVRDENGFIDSFNVNVGIHQVFVPSPLLFILVLEALSQGFRTGCPW